MALAKNRRSRKKRRMSFEVLEVRSLLNTDWTEYGNSSDHSGYVSGLLEDISDQPAWSQKWNNPDTLNQAVTGLGLVYVSGGDRLSALDQNTGNVVWSHLFGPNYGLGAPSYD